MNSHWEWNWRKKKKFMRNASNSIEAGGFFEDCRGHPCRVTEILPYRPSNPWTFFEASVNGVSLLNDLPISCSIYHCAPTPLTQKEAAERAVFYASYGEPEYMNRYVYKTTINKGL